MVGGMPSSESLRGSLFNAGFAYRCAACASALVFLPASAWLTPTVGYGSRVMTTAVLARAIGARHRMTGTGPSEKWEVEKYEGNGKPWSFNAVLDTVVGMFVFGIAASQTSDKAGMLQIRLAGAAPNAGEHHFASPSDCLSWPARQGSFVIDNEVPPEGREASCANLLSEWKVLDQAYACGDRTGCARRVPGCPVCPVGEWVATVCCC